MTVERTDPPTLAPPVHDIYSHVAVGRGSAIVGIAGQIALDADGNLVGAGEVITKEYGARIDEWQRWDDVSKAAFGA